MKVEINFPDKPLYWYFSVGWLIFLALVFIVGSMFSPVMLGILLTVVFITCTTASIIYLFERSS